MYHRHNQEKEKPHNLHTSALRKYMYMHHCIYCESLGQITHCLVHTPNTESHNKESAYPLNMNIFYFAKSASHFTSGLSHSLTPEQLVVGDAMQ